MAVAGDGGLHRNGIDGAKHAAQQQQRDEDTLQHVELLHAAPQIGTEYANRKFQGPASVIQSQASGRPTHYAGAGASSEVTTAEARRPALRRTLAEGLAFIRQPPRLDLSSLIADAPRGDGHCVLVLPALGRGDPYTQHIRIFLAHIGYAACGWNLGVNVGPSKRLLDGAARRLLELSAEHGPVSIVGFSMGGLFARWLALNMPDSVRQVITVCSPIHQPARNFWLPMEPFLGVWRGHDVRALAEQVPRPLPVPCTALYSRSDGLVNWRACLDTSCTEDCMEIGGPHVLIACNPRVVALIGERLARVSNRAGEAL